MAKFSVKVYYQTFCYREVEAENRNEAYDRACTAIDASTDEEFKKEIVRNLTNVHDPEINNIN